MLKPLADGVLVHESEFIQTQTVVVRGDDGVLLIDPGITRAELRSLAREIRALGTEVAVGFSTHFHWDHVLWHPDLGAPPRLGTSATVRALDDLLRQDDWREQIAEGLPLEHADDIPMELLGELTALPEGTTRLPWAGPGIRLLEHRAHAPGHTALLIEHARVLVVGDLLSDGLVPFLDRAAAHPLSDYLAALDLIESVLPQVDSIVPGHGSIARGAEVADRIALDRAYVEAVRDGREPDDPRLGPHAIHHWMRDVHRGQAAAFAGRD